MKNLLIIGARGLGREMYSLREDYIGYNETFVYKGYLDSDKTLLDGYEGYPPILSSVEDYEIQENDVFICALGDPKAKQKYINIIREKQGEFISLISKTATISPHVKIGTGCIIFSQSLITADIKIGDFVSVFPCVVIGHDAIIEDFSVLDSHAFMGGFSHVKKVALISTGAKIMPHKTVGEYAVVNAGSIVARDVPDRTTVMGVPAIESRSWLKMILNHKR
ncbi:acetyltransferase [Bacteroides sp. An19]|uniref:acetyltransferase n=1 Tax=Bacteroides sp. An19 TaxID=1965580 RepID=UPI000B37D0F9|nr:acetyltransferase [Bacteroides sp. An19]OUP30929.1 hypothetical protein B5F25_12845 [Bacteroides sp. An19]